MGVGEGGGLRGLLRNIMVNELEKEVERGGDLLVGYGDELVMFCKRGGWGEGRLDNVVGFIERKVFVKVNKDKRDVGYMGEMKLVWYGFGGRNGKWEL